MAVRRRYGSSERRGRPARELAEAAQIELAGLEAGSVKLLIEPSQPSLSAEFNELSEVVDTLVGGLGIVVRTSRQLRTLPDGFDAGVVQALQPMESLYRQHRIQVVSFDSLTGNPQHARVQQPHIEALLSIEPAPRERIPTLVGRLLMANFNNHKCTIWDPNGRAHHVAFPPELDEQIKKSLRGWVEAEFEEEAEGSDSPIKVEKVTALSDEEVDEISPPREGRWPRSVLASIRKQAEADARNMNTRPHLPEYELDD
jgi:hypothetical protein